MRFMSLSSGSCGNCYYLGTGDKGLLIDAGVNFKRLKKVLEDNSLSFDSFGGILVTHDHLDHIRHLGQFCRKLYKPVYTTSVLRTALLRHTFTAGSFGACSKVLEEGVWNELDEASVKYFIVPPLPPLNRPVLKKAPSPSAAFPAEPRHLFFCFSRKNRSALYRIRFDFRVITNANIAWRLQLRVSHAMIKVLAYSRGQSCVM